MKRFFPTWAIISIALSALLLPVVVNAAPADDTQTALVHIRWAWDDHGPCTKIFLCMTAIDHVEFKWQDGSISFGPRVQRITTSAHDCIQNAKDAVGRGERGLAVEWVMASQIHNPPVKDWLRTHPDAVIAALGIVR